MGNQLVRSGQTPGEKSKKVAFSFLKRFVALFVSGRLQTWRKAARRGPPREPEVPGSARLEGKNPVCRARQTAPPRDTSGLRTVNGFHKSDGADRSLAKLAASAKPSTAAETGPRSRAEKVRKCAAPLWTSTTQKPAAACGEKTETRSRKHSEGGPRDYCGDARGLGQVPTVPARVRRGGRRSGRVHDKRSGGLKRLDGFCVIVSCCSLLIYLLRLSSNHLWSFPSRFKAPRWIFPALC